MWCVYVGWVLCVCPDASYQFIKPINPLGCEELSIAAGSINAASSRLKPVLKMYLPLLVPQFFFTAHWQLGQSCSRLSNVTS